MTAWFEDLRRFYEVAAAEGGLLGERSGAFYRGLGASFDVNFTDVSDRDAGFQQAQYGAGDEVWWDAADYRRSAALIRGFTRTSGLRTVIWQIPLGNTRMRAVDGTWNHYQDVHVETLLDDPDRSVLRDYVRAGVVALIFGRGADGATCACDGNGDGVTDPEPVNGNDRRSLSADDDGGFFDERAGAYYAEGPLPLAQPA
jgi:hypothetical protein